MNFMSGLPVTEGGHGIFFSVVFRICCYWIWKCREKTGWKSLSWFEGLTNEFRLFFIVRT